MDTFAPQGRAFVFSDYVEGNERKILSMFNDVFGLQRTLEEWRWEFKDNPAGRPIIKLLWLDDQLIGQYSLVCRHIKIGYLTQISLLSVDTMIHPDFRNMGLFTELAKTAYSKARKLGYSLVYGFPNSNSYDGFVSKLGWTGHKLQAYSTRKPMIKKLEQYTYRRIEETKWFDNRFDKLWDAYRHEVEIATERSQRYLNWRYLSKPKTPYTVFSIFEGDVLDGYVVLKTFEKENKRLGHIVDAVCKDVYDMRTLFATSYGYFKIKDVDEIVCWAPSGSMFAAVLEDDGFTRIESDMCFGYLCLDKASSVDQYKDWYLTMGDSDVF